jgi:hypothetical protein
MGAAASTSRAPVVAKRGPPIVEPEELVDAYCQPCEDSPPVQRQRTHELQRQATLRSNNGGGEGGGGDVPELTHQVSDTGVQRINVPFKAWEIGKAAAWLEDEEQSGLGALRPLHRLSTSERLSAWKEGFSALDLGDYDELAAACAESAAAGTATEGTPHGYLAALSLSVLLIEPNRFFPCHKHPDIELVFCARGALYENRVLVSALLNKPSEDKAKLVDSGFPKYFKVGKVPGGSTLFNARYSVHQSYTLDEGAVLLVLWNGKHTNLTDPDHLLWDPSRCVNPGCMLACPDKTFEALARNSAGKRDVGGLRQ